MAAALGGVLLLGSGAAWAGELKIGAEPHELDDKGKLTKDARAKAVTELESSVPGDELWSLFLWAKIDNGADGPLYLEFYREYQGKTLMAHRMEYDGYGGERYITMDVEIGRSEGFRTGETITIAFVQNMGAKDVKKAKATVKLLASSKKPEPPPSGDDDGGDGPVEGETDALAGEDEPDPPDADPEPPPIEPTKKKGCTIGTAVPPLWLLLGIIGMARGRRFSPGERTSRR